MKKTFFLKSAAIALLSLLMVACGKKADPTPAPPAAAKVFTSIVSQGSVSNGSANVTGTVTISDGTAYLKLIGTSNQYSDQDRVYIDPTPQFTWGYTNDFKWGNFELSLC